MLEVAVDVERRGWCRASSSSSAPSSGVWVGTGEVCAEQRAEEDPRLPAVAAHRLGSVVVEPRLDVARRRRAARPRAGRRGGRRCRRVDTSEWLMPRPAVIRLTSPGRTIAWLPALSVCSTSPVNSQLTVCSPVCGWGAHRHPAGVGDRGRARSGRRSTTPRSASGAAAGAYVVPASPAARPAGPRAAAAPRRPSAAAHGSRTSSSGSRSGLVIRTAARVAGLVWCRLPAAGALARPARRCRMRRRVDAPGVRLGGRLEPHDHRLRRRAVAALGDVVRAGPAGWSRGSRPRRTRAAGRRRPRGTPGPAAPTRPPTR